jgi:hypothetical protein
MITVFVGSIATRAAGVRPLFASEHDPAGRRKARQMFRQPLMLSARPEGKGFAQYSPVHLYPAAGMHGMAVVLPVRDQYMSSEGDVVEIRWVKLPWPHVLVTEAPRGVVDSKALAVGSVAGLIPISLSKVVA